MTDFEQLEAALWKQFTSPEANGLDMILPITELSKESSTLVLGYGAAQKSARDAMIPYFHVCGENSGKDPLRTLIIGGWHGTERLSVYSAASMLGAIQNRLRIVAGMEVTAYPAVNVEATRAGEFLTPDQQAGGVGLWKDSQFPHVQVLERELMRYPYHLILVLRENSARSGFQVTLWPSGNGAESVLGDSLRRLQTHAGDDLLEWSVNPPASQVARNLTPMPGDCQPTEVVVEIPTTGDAKLAKEQTLGLVLTLLHAARQGRMEGLL
ncbi:MAG: hypothetical protein WEB60_11595 [Terrimicrobiaceae bacterium]